MTIRNRPLLLALLSGVTGGAFAPNAFAEAAPAATEAVRDSRIHTFDIPAAPLSQSLADFARQSGVQALFSYEKIGATRGNAVRGAFTRDEALRRLLAGTPFQGSISADGLLSVQASLPESAGAPAPDGLEATPQQQRQSSNSASDEIVVTGTRIRGQGPVGARIIAIDREDIADSGLSTASQLLRKLPQSLGAAYDQHVNLALSANISAGSGVNLRGLGADATLVLVDGRRVPATGRGGDYADISAIPLGLIERVEVLPDSASAVYGSDAVGGVVNFVLRKSADGPELAAHFGAVTHGALEEYRLSALTGASGRNWRFLVAAEHYDRSALETADRDFLASSDLRPLGGANFNSPRANPAVLNVAGVGSFSVPAGQDGTALTQAQLLPAGANRGNTNFGVDAMPAQTLDLLYASGGVDIGADISLFASARMAARRYAARSAFNNARITLPATNAFRLAGNLFPGRTITVDYDFSQDVGPRRLEGTVRSLDLSTGGDLSIGDTWRGELTFAYAREFTDSIASGSLNSTALAAALADSNPATALNVLGDGSFTNPATLARLRGYLADEGIGETWSANLKFDGALFTLPAGPVRLAVGGEFRSEYFGVHSESFSSGVAPIDLVTSKGDREITAGFAELLLPVFGAEATLPFVQRLDLSFALRAERYSDFGETANPRVGLRFDPVAPLSFRAAWGRSFRAPNLSDLDTANTSGRREVRLLNFADPYTPSGRSDGLIILGANPDLKEQTAESTTAGIAFTPAWAGKPVIDLGFFDVRFKDRIASVPTSTPTLAPQSEYAQFVNRTPSLALVTALLQEAALRAPIGAITPADIDLVLDARTTNLAITNVQGLDAHAETTFTTLGGELQVTLDATWVLQFERAAAPTAPVLQVADTFANPIDIKARLGAVWRTELGDGDTVTAAAFFNYADDYTDRSSNPARRIQAWKTVDLRLAFTPDTRNRRGFVPGVALSVQNVFDENPPFVNNAAGVGYDPANADPLGRFVSIDLTARF